MIDIKTWNKFVDDDSAFKNKRKVRITCVDGEIYEGKCDFRSEEEDSHGDNVWSVIVGARIFIQEDIEKIEFID